MAGVLLTLLIGRKLRAAAQARFGEEPREHDPEPQAEAETKVKRLRRAPVALLGALLAAALLLPGKATAQAAINLPSVPATMATDAPQRMADGGLFVPKATQHLLSVRTVLTAETRAPAHRAARGHGDR